MDRGTRIAASIAGGFIPSVISVFIFFVLFVYSLFAPLGGGEMGPGLTIPIVLLGLLVLMFILWGIASLILLCAGPSWKLLWWITGVMGTLSLLTSIALYKGL